MEVSGKPFKKPSFIRLDPIFTVENVKIKQIRAKPIFRLTKKKNCFTKRESRELDIKITIKIMSVKTVISHVYSIEFTLREMKALNR